MIYPAFIPPDNSGCEVRGWPGIMEGVPFVRWGRGRDMVAIKDVLRYDPCAYCGGPSGTVDHIVPTAERSRYRRVESGWPNLTGACEPCNRRKRNLPLLDFLLNAPESKRLYRVKGAYFTSEQIETMQRALG